MELGEDAEIDYTDLATGEALIDEWPGSELVTTRGLGRLAHYRILRPRAAINAGVDFIGAAQQSAV